MRYDKNVMVNLKSLLLIVKCLLVQGAYDFCQDLAEIFTTKRPLKDVLAKSIKICPPLSNT